MTAPAGRLWTHYELPAGKPSAAGYREGCRCDECREAMRAYNRGYAARKQLSMTTELGTTIHHSHRGRPTAKSAIKWTCRHEVCLALAGFRIIGGRVYDPTLGDFRAEFD